MELYFSIMIILSLAVLTLGIFVVIFYKRLKSLSLGNNAQSLESIIVETHEYVKRLAEHQKKLTVDVRNLEEDATHNIQNIGVVRFNPFKETGGSQSFAIALTDKHRNGIVLSSLYTRDRVNIFAKPVTKGSSEYLLMKEELEALEQSYK